MTANLHEKFNAGMTAFLGQYYGTCIENLSEVLREDSAHRLALVSRGAAFLRTGQIRTALTDFDRALEVDAGYYRAYHLRGLAREIEGDDEGALQDFAKAIELAPEYGAAYHSRATLLTKMGQLDQATEDIQMVTQLTQQNIESFADENNVWRSNHMQVESMMETELNR